ncbi:hypothetical protein, partial [Spirulina sp. 06S082]|uniref:hypothetical protein n=1 Tax=Spirulina sp. 06S082 TaxID=3110248 RepID=UPI002B1F9803
HFLLIFKKTLSLKEKNPSKHLHTSILAFNHLYQLFLVQDLSFNYFPSITRVKIFPRFNFNCILLRG